MKTFFYLSTLILAPIIFGSIGCSNTPKSDSQRDTTNTTVHNQVDGNRSPGIQTEKTYRVLAKVTAVSETDSTITIDHEKMEGFMEAMEMPYQVGDLSIFKKIRVGTKGHFTIKVVNGEGTITNVHIHNK